MTTFLTRLGAAFKAWRTSPPGRAAAVFAPAPGSTAGWWRADPAEQVRHFTSWTYAAVNAIAQEAARHQPHLTEITPAGPIPLPPAHPLCRLLARPNPWLSPWELWYLTVVYLELTGNCFWYVAPGADGPAELWVVPSPWVTVVPDATQFVARYEVRTGAGRAESFTPAEMVHLKYPNPADPHWGLSPLQANALAVDANTELLQSRHQLFRSGARPGVLLQTDQTLSDQTVARLEERLTDRFSGRGNWHRPLVLEQGLTASPWTFAPAEMDFPATSRLTRDEILALFRVPAPVLGVAENIGLGSGIWDGARLMFCEGTVQPKLDLIGHALTRDLADRFGLALTVTFPDCSPRAADRKREAEAADVQLGVRSVGEVRLARGLSATAEV